MPPTSKRNKFDHSHSSRKKRNAKFDATNSSKNSKGLVRIIAGFHRGRRLPVLVSEGLRPTSDRVKETLFNWLMLSVQGSVCLDMFAGSGGLGIEALSRGAAKVVFMENAKTIAAQLEKNISVLKETEKAIVLCDNALNAKLHETPFDIVFIDPPFGKSLIQSSINKLIENKALQNGAYIYIESSHDDEYAVPESFEPIKHLKTSQVHACLFKYNT